MVPVGVVGEFFTRDPPYLVKDRKETFRMVLSASYITIAVDAVCFEKKVVWRRRHVRHTANLPGRFDVHRFAAGLKACRSTSFFSSLLLKTRSDEQKLTASLKRPNGTKRTPDSSFQVLSPC